MRNKLDIFIKSICAGVLITVGCIVKLKTENPVAGALLFALGLYFICHFGLNLFTGKIAYLNKSNALDMGIIWGGNLVGTFCAGSAARIADSSLVEKAELLVGAKVDTPFWKLIILGVFCGILMFLAVDNYKNSQYGDLGILLGVSGFILAGFEHSIADMGYFVLGLTKEINLSSAALTIITISLANAIGAIVFYHLSKKRI